MHKTVLLQETIDSLGLADKPARKLMVVDATFGGGGHSLEICKRYPGVKIIALDQDESAWRYAKSKFKNLSCSISFVNSNFRDLDKVLESFGAKLPKGSLAPKLDGIIFDLGLSSDQLENSGRGFSFMKNEPLLMTMKENPSPEDVTALDVVNTWSEENLASIIHGYGQERFSKRIARGIAEARAKKKIKTSFDLVKIISDAVPLAYKKGRLHFATRTFQAIRIAVNDELGALAEGLEKGLKVLRVGGRMSVVSFHSLEDRIVKRFFKTKVMEGQGLLINKKIISANNDEIKYNPRSRSAKLRIIERIK